MGFILFKSGFIMDQKGIKVFMKSLLQIYHTTFLENLVKIVGVSYDIPTYLKPNVASIDTYILLYFGTYLMKGGGVCNITIFDPFDAFNPLT